MERSLLFVFSLVLSGLTGYAQQVQKCCGTQNSTFLWGNTNYANHTQCIYLPSELQGAVPGSITRLYYRYGTSGQGVDQVLTEVHIGFLQNNATTFNNLQFFTGITPAYYSPAHTIPVGVSGDWFMIELDQPFLYDPQLSLIVDVLFETSTTINFGTLASSAPGRKLYSPDITSPTGSSTVSNVQDLGFDLDLFTSLDERKPMVFSLMPNPATDQLTVSFPTQEIPLTLDIFDLSGRLVLATQAINGNERVRIDLSGMVQGSYLMRATDRDGAVSSKLFVVE